MAKATIEKATGVLTVDGKKIFPLNVKRSRKLYRELSLGLPRELSLGRLRVLRERREFDTSESAVRG
jgi:hypothetical protein